MQQGGSQGLGVKMPLRKNAGYSQGMGNVGFTTLAELAGMRIAAGFESAEDQGQIRRRKVSQLTGENDKFALRLVASRNCRGRKNGLRLCPD